MRITDTSDLWWKSAVVYCLDIETFMDWNDDGVGDLEGLAHRIDYLAELGVTCLWLMPFYPTPGRDDGYYITDFYGVDSRFGHHGDFVEVVRTARDRGMRVIIDLVVNHTSDAHPWFLSAKSARDAPYRDFYVWRDTAPTVQQELVFPGEESSVWEFDAHTEQYYLHSFYSHQPDLNVNNRLVRDEIEKVMGFWIQLGVSGFRLDAVPYLLDTGGTDDAEDPHSLLQSMRAFLGRRSGEAMLLGEVNLPHAEQVAYFGGAGAEDPATGLSMQFDFVGMQALYLSLARKNAAPLEEALRARPAIPVAAQWANFVRNHDELTLDKLTESERQEVFAAFGPEPEMQIYDRGLVRRLPPMLGGDQRRIRMVYSLLFSLPGTPVLFYGEEIGMGENLAVPGRKAVRTPMQWTPDPGGGFSSAAPEAFAAPVVSGAFGPEAINVSEQRNDQASLLLFMRRIIRRYRSSPEIGWGELTILDSGNPAVLAHQLRGAEGRIIALHNFGDTGTDVVLEIPDAAPGIRLVDVIAERETPEPDGGSVTLPLGPYDFRWLRVLQPGDKSLH